MRPEAGAAQKLVPRAGVVLELLVARSKTIKTITDILEKNS